MAWQTAVRQWLGSSALQRGPAWPALAAAIGFVSTLTFTVPMVPATAAMVTLAPRRWVGIALAGAVGSAAAGAVLIHYLGHWGGAYIAAQMPQLAASAHWQHLLDWTDRYGLFALAAYAISPLPQLPGLVAFALLGLSGAEGFFALWLGKGAKYLVAAGLTAHGVGWIRRWPAFVRFAESVSDQPRAG